MQQHVFFHFALDTVDSQTCLAKESHSKEKLPLLSGKHNTGACTTNFLINLKFLVCSAVHKPRISGLLRFPTPLPLA